MGNPPGVCGCFVYCSGLYLGLRYGLSTRSMWFLVPLSCVSSIHSGICPLRLFHSLAWLKFFSIQSVLQLLLGSVSFLLQLSLHNHMFSVGLCLQNHASLWLIHTEDVTTQTHSLICPLRLFHSLAWLKFFSIQSVLQLMLGSVSSFFKFLCITTCSLWDFLCRTPSSLWIIHTEDVTTQHGLSAILSFSFHG